jgi:hypothetical protein
VVLDDSAFGWPAAHLFAVPSGDYLVQVVLNRYETFHLADGRTLKLPPDKGEGQHWAEKPGNLYSKPLRVHIDAAHPQKTALMMDQSMAPIVAKTDTEFVKHIKIRSELLSKFWGRDVYLGAHVLLPKDFDKHPEAHFPIMVFHGHNYYLTDSVYFAQERLESLRPAYGGSVAYGERVEHCWNGDTKLANAYSRLHYDFQYLPIILQRIRAAAPPGSDLTSWRY